MKRLFTIGCSYTKYAWPTWADMLFYDFDYSENWGMMGLGCRAIAERVAECHARNNFTPEDTVIVQWTTHLRHDFYLLESPLKRLPGWQTFGSMFSPLNKLLYDRKWLDNFFYEPAYVMHCLNFMLMTQGLLKSTGCNWYMTSIGDWSKLSSDIPQLKKYGEVLVKIEDTIWDNEQGQLDFYKKSIWDPNQEHWIDPIESSLIPFKDNRYDFFDIKEKKIWDDPHPTIKQHAYYFKEILRPKLNLNNNINENLELWISEITQIYKDTKHDVNLFNSSLKDSKFQYAPKDYTTHHFGF